MAVLQFYIRVYEHGRIYIKSVVFVFLMQPLSLEVVLFRICMISFVLLFLFVLFTTGYFNCLDYVSPLRSEDIY